MKEYKREFIEFMVESGALLFGEFTLKSGRKAPYFMNAGKYKTGREIERLGEYYAACFLENNVKANILAGPAYKGIPLAVATSIALSRAGKETEYLFDRKEVKDHGEGGMFVGAQLKKGDRICVVEDVMTSGKALREFLPKLMGEADVKAEDMLISVDRQEKGLGEKSAAEEVYEEFGVRVHAIVTVEDIMQAMEEGVIEGKEHLPAMRAYLEKYGA